MSTGIKLAEDINGRVLTYEYFQHYQRIIVAVAETEKLMEETDNIVIV
jgi:hypothetical protein